MFLPLTHTFIQIISPFVYFYSLFDSLDFCDYAALSVFDMSCFSSHRATFIQNSKDYEWMISKIVQIYSTYWCLLKVFAFERDSLVMYRSWMKRISRIVIVGRDGSFINSCSVYRNWKIRVIFSDWFFGIKFLSFLW